MEKTLKNFAIIGVGSYIAPRHLQAIRDTENLLLATVDTLDKYSFKVQFFTEIERFDRRSEKLRKGTEIERIHFVSNCSSNYLHDANWRLALHIGYKTGDFPQVEKASPESFALPLYPDVTGSQQDDEVIGAVKAFVG
ncbi:MAG: hypothetical protein JNM46_04815 [Anaerolineales bacterium]|nr:hypothetical protein [Anaerolineales bacterium]